MAARTHANACKLPDLRRLIDLEGFEKEVMMEKKCVDESIGWSTFCLKKRDFE